MEIMMSFAEAILFIVVPQAEAWGFCMAFGKCKAVFAVKTNENGI